MSGPTWYGPDGRGGSFGTGRPSRSRVRLVPQVLPDGQAGLVDGRSDRRAEVPVVPGLEGVARDVRLPHRIAAHEPEPPGVLDRPPARRGGVPVDVDIDLPGRLEVDRRPQLVLRVSGPGGLPLGGLQ